MALFFRELNKVLELVRTLDGGDQDLDHGAQGRHRQQGAVRFVNAQPCEFGRTLRARPFPTLRERFALRPVVQQRPFGLAKAVCGAGVLKSRPWTCRANSRIGFARPALIRHARRWLWTGGWIRCQSGGATFTLDGGAGA